MCITVLSLSKLHTNLFVSLALRVEGCGGFSWIRELSSLSVKLFPFPIFLFLLVKRDKKEKKVLLEGGGMRRVAEEAEEKKMQAGCGLWRVVEGVEGFRKSPLGKK